MLVLLFVLQFFAYMSMWKIEYSDIVAIVLKELKRVANGELFDDIDIGVINDLKDFFGIRREMSEADATSPDKESLPKQSIVESIGVTQILFLVVAVVFAASMVVLIYLCCKCKCCAKNKTKLKKKLSGKNILAGFVNFLIGFAYFNWLKVCFGLGLTLRGLLFGEDFNLENSFGLAFFVLYAVGLPLLFVWIMKCKFDDLDDEATRSMFGKVYEGISLTRRLKDNNAASGFIRVKRKDIWVYPLVFLARRTAFIVISILLFDKPNV